MKVFAAIAIFAVIAASVNAFEITRVEEPEADLCPLCMQLMEEAIEQLINIIANVGVLGTCGELCGKLPQKLEAEACDIICSVVGIDEFIKLVDKTDPDPVSICQDLKVCAIHDNGAATCNSLVVSPTSGPQGTTFDIVGTFTVTNQTGAGEVALGVSPPGGMPFGDGELNPGLAPGQYQVKFGLKAQPNEEEPFMPGNYPVQLVVCNGMCGASHPHTKTLCQANGQFTITQ